MARLAQGRQPSVLDGWVALGWGGLALLGAGILGALSVPETTPSPFTDYARGDFLRPEWLVLATLLAWPVFWASRASWLVALPVVAIMSAESWYVVDTAFDAMHQAGIGGSSAGWFLFAAVQAGIFAAAGIAGACHCVARRRWTRRMRRLVPELADSRLFEADELPAWEEGFSTG
jgi:hypothetical protein